MKFNRNRIELALAQAGLKGYNQLAQRMGCSPQNLSVIVNRGRCKPATVAKLAHALGVDMEEIMEEENSND